MFISWWFTCLSRWVQVSQVWTPQCWWTIMLHKPDTYVGSIPDWFRTRAAPRCRTLAAHCSQCSQWVKTDFCVCGKKLYWLTGCLVHCMNIKYTSFLTKLCDATLRNKHPDSSITQDLKWFITYSIFCRRQSSVMTKHSWHIDTFMDWLYIKVIFYSKNISQWIMK